MAAASHGGDWGLNTLGRGKWIDHIKVHYIDKSLVKKEWIAKDIIYLNYDSVLSQPGFILIATTLAVPLS
jgi:hypothetical protein